MDAHIVEEKSKDGEICFLLVSSNTLYSGLNLSLYFPSILDNYTLSNQEHVKKMNEELDTFKDEDVSIKEEHSVQKYNSDYNANLFCNILSSLLNTNTTDSLEKQHTCKETELSQQSCEKTIKCVVRIKMCDAGNHLRKSLKAVMIAKHECNNSGKKCKTPNKLIRHMRRHTGDKTLICEVCGKTFSDSSGLSRHKKIHRGGKAYKCDECSKRFHQSANLITHIRTHNPQKAFQCRKCNAQFLQKGNLTVHMRIHTGDKPFTCKECNLKFSQKISLMKHKRVHDGEKPFSCEICDKAFSYHNSLIRHKSTHSNKKSYSCNECDQLYARSSSLIRHLQRCHGREEPYDCSECHKQFKLKRLLKMHKCKVLGR